MKFGQLTYKSVDHGQALSKLVVQLGVTGVNHGSVLFEYRAVSQLAKNCWLSISNPV